MVGSSAEKAKAKWPSIAGVALVAATVLFNAVLAIVNAHVHAIGYGAVAVVQALLTACAALVVLVARPKGIGPWLAYLWLAMCGFLFLALLRGRAEPRYVADILTILVFVMLGLALRRRDLLTGLVALQAVVCVVALWELASAQSFAAVFMVKDFYVNTRGFLDDAVWSGPENLFISSERPGGRLFGAALDLHRASSVFLEPVSLGNWTVIVTLAIAALRPARRVIVFLVATNLFLLFACDGRLALAVNLILLVTWPILPRLPVWAPPLFLPLMLVGLVMASWFNLLGPVDDTLGGRFAYSINYLGSLGTRDLLGFYDKGGIVAADSGWAYLILTQSIFGLVGIWLALTVTGRTSPEARHMIGGVALFIATCLPITYSLFSIKTAGMLWAVYGVAIARQNLTKSAPSKNGKFVAVTETQLCSYPELT